ncbi:hypothetical protein WJX79_009725 [Trebouxia sp. C0005]
MEGNCRALSSQKLVETGRIAFVLIDGLADVHIPALANLTPLEAADTSAMDAIAAAGLNGLLDPVEPGLACGSDTAHLSIFGYDPRLYYRGRGAFESMGAGIDMAPGDIAFKCNFATLDITSGTVIKRRADRHFEDVGPILCAALDGVSLPSFPELVVKAKYATEHRCGIVISGPGLSDEVSGTDPLKDNLPLQVSRPVSATAQAQHTAAVVNELSGVLQAVLQDHQVNKQRIAHGSSPANVVLLRGCGSRIAVPTFLERHGMRACMVAPTKIIAGLGMSLGIDRLDAPGTTGDYRTQFHAKAETLSEALTSGQYDFGFLHIKAVDDTGHDQQPVLKVQYLECVDVMIKQLVRRLHQAEAGGQGHYCVCVTGDHSTPVLFGDHSHEPVPFTVAHVRHVVEQLGGASCVMNTPLTHIPHPSPSDPSVALHALAQAALRRRKMNPLMETQSTGDVVNSFGEAAAAAGFLGRFPGIAIMPLVQQFIGMNLC